MWLTVNDAMALLLLAERVLLVMRNAGKSITDCFASFASKIGANVDCFALLASYCLLFSTNGFATSFSR